MYLLGLFEHNRYNHYIILLAFVYKLHIPKHYLHPRYWLIWLSLACAWLIAQMPYKLQMFCGRALGQCLLYLSPKRKKIAQTNIRLCFPALNEQAQLDLVKKHFLSLGCGFVETAMSWWTPAHKLMSLIQLSGKEHLDKALAEGKGVILLSAHFTTLEIGGRLLALNTPFHVLYRSHKNPVFEHIMHHARCTHFEKAIPRDDMRGMIKSLKANTPVWYAPDQDFGIKNAVFVPFFNIAAATTTGTSRLAKLTGAQVVPFFQQRLANNQGYQLTILPALEQFPSDDNVVDSQRINTLIEQQIIKQPEQYLWVHRRFKTRPEGEDKFY